MVILRARLVFRSVAALTSVTSVTRVRVSQWVETKIHHAYVLHVYLCRRARSLTRRLRSHSYAHIGISRESSQPPSI